VSSAEVGGEGGGSVLLSMERARTNSHRGFICSWPQLAAPGGLLLANLAVLAEIHQHAVAHLFRYVSTEGMARPL
jgi:hypothetical protein